MKFRRLIYPGLLFCLLILSGSTITETDAATDDMPALYYFDHNRNAYVMQHVDGNKGYLFADDIIFDDHNTISGPGWSPSGKWFAWTSAFAMPLSAAYIRYPWLIHRDSIRRTPLLDGFETSSLQLFWNPRHDILEMRDSDDNVYLIDPNTESFLAAFDHIPYNAFIEWNSTGEHFYLLRTIGSYDDPTTTLIVGSIDGTYTERPLPDVFQWAPDGRLLYLSPDRQHFIFEDIADHSLTEIELPARYVSGVNWSPDGIHGLVVTSRESDTDPPPYWLFSLDTLSFAPIQSNINMHFPFSWSPDGSKYLLTDGMNVSYIDISTQQLVRTGVSLEGTGSRTKFTWLDDGLRLVVLGDDVLNLYDFEAGTVETLWDGVRTYEISPNEELIALHGDCGRGELCILDIATKQIVNQIPIHSWASGWCCLAAFSWHPDSQWLIGSLPTGNGNQYRYFFYTDVEGRAHHELGFCTWGPHCVGWLPESTEIDEGRLEKTLLPELPDTEVITGDTLNFRPVWNGEQTLLATDNGKQVLVFNRDGSLLDAIETGAGIYQILWNGNHILIRYSVDIDERYPESRLGVWDLKQRKMIFEQPARKVSMEPNWIFLEQEGQTEILSAEDYSIVAVVEHTRNNPLWHTHDRIALSVSGGIKVWDVSADGLTEFALLETPETEPNTQRGIYGFDPLGRHFAITIGPEVLIWELERRKVIFRQGFDGYFIGFSPRGNYITVLETDQDILVYEIQTGELVQQLPYSYHTVWSDDEEIIAVYDYDIPLTIWDLQRDKLIYKGGGLKVRWHWEVPDEPIAISEDYIAVGGSAECAVPCTLIISRESLEVITTINRQSYLMQWLDNSTMAADNVRSVSITEIVRQ